MTFIRQMPAETFGRVTARLGGRIRYIHLGRFVIAWHTKESKP